MATSEEYAAWIVKNADKRGTPEFETVAKAYRTARAIPETAQPAEPTTAEQVAANPATRFAVGAAQPVQGLVQRLSEQSMPIPGPIGALQLLAMKTRPAVDKAFSDVNAMATQGGHEGYDIAGIAGNVLSPLSLGAGKLGQPASLAGRTAMGSAIGAAGGMLAPAENADASRINALIGGAVGGVLPPVIQGATGAVNWLGNNIVRPVADLLTKKGPENIARKYVGQIIGPDQLPAVLDRTGTVNQLIPGSKPTVSEAVAGLPEGSPLASLQNITARTPGGPSSAFGQRLLDQSAAVKAAEEARHAASSVNYGKAFDIKLNPVQGDDALATIAKNPFFKDAVPAAMKLANAKNLDPTVNLTEFLHDVKLGLDRKLKGGMGEEALSNAQYKEIQKVKTQLVEWLGKNNPDYEAGRVAHAKASQAIADDLARRDLGMAQQQTTNLAGGLNVAEQTRPHTPNLLSRPAMIANFLLRKAGKDVEPKVDAALTEMMLDPAKFTQVMSQLPPKTRVEFERLMNGANALSFGGASAQR